MATEQDAVATWIGHIDNLASKIGPRGSTTEGERQGSEYCRAVLAGLGFDPEVEGFRSARSIYQPHLLAASLMLLSFAIYPLAGRVSALAAAVLAWIVLGSEVLELSFRANPLRWILPKGNSQNVVAIAPAEEMTRQDIVLIGHVDSHRTPIVFSSERWLAAYKAFTMVAFTVFVLQASLYLVGAITLWPWIWPATLVGVAAAVLLILMCVQADSTPFSAGALDNASGAGLVLTVAERLRIQPLRFSRVWLVCTGCEEVQHYGAIDFFRRHRQGFLEPRAIAFDGLGCAGPSWLTKEGIVVPFFADRELVTLAERLAEQHPEWGAHASVINGGNSEMADALRVGIPAITITGLTRSGDAPYWHQVEDTVDKVDRAVLSRAFAFVSDYLELLDQRAPAADRSPIAP